MFCPTGILFVVDLLFRIMAASSVKKIGPPITAPLIINMRGYSPKQNDDYVATSAKIVHPGYILRYEPSATSDRVHHMLLYGCSEPASSNRTWTGSHTCLGVSKILYAWARNAAGLELPPDVGVSIGHKNDGIRYLVLQVHYATMFTVSAFLKRGNKWTMIGKRNPQWPQIFQKINKSLTIRSGDVMAAQCRYDSSSKDHIVNMGMTGNDEMCNFYMMYYRLANSPDPFPRGSFCSQPTTRRISSEYPIRGSLLLDSRPDLEHHAQQSAIKFGNSDRKRRNIGQDDNDESKRRRPPLGENKIWKEIEECRSCVVDQNHWTQIGDVHLGQVAGLAIDPAGRLVVFHRGPVVWGVDSFDYSHRLINKTAIDDDLVLVVDTDVDPPKILAKWGRNKFFLPHGIFVDKSGSFYTTDVGSHQVLKHSPSREGMTLSLTLGEQFIPGSDNGHFCQPSAASTASDGTIFVADGYCNSRVVKFSAKGVYLGQWGKRSSGPGTASLGSFILPHDLIIDNENGLVRVADRSNGRVQTFQFDGLVIGELKLPEKFETIYSLDMFDDTLYLLPGEKPLTNPPTPIRAFAFSIHTGLPLYSWAPKMAAFHRPHILRVGKSGQHIFVGEISTGILWRFQVKREWQSMHLSLHNHPGNGQVETNKPTTTIDESSPINASSSLLLLTTFVCICILLALIMCIFLRSRRPRQLVDRIGRAPLFARDVGFRHRSSRYYIIISGGGDCVQMTTITTLRHLKSACGFRPLNTEDIDAVDDLTTDESDQEDTLYASKLNELSNGRSIVQ